MARIPLLPPHQQVMADGEWGYFSPSNKMAGRKEITQLSDSELLDELRSLGLNAGPISPTTRRIYEKKLSKARGNDAVNSLACKDYDSENSCLKLNSTPCTDSSKALITYSTDEVSLGTPAIFYGVYFNNNQSFAEGGSPSVPLVFTCKEKALDVAKKYKGARFKAFKTRSEAERFSQSLSVVQENVAATLSSSALASPTDPASHFKGPTPQALIEFRKVIEHGSLEEFRQIVFKNPRYLVGPGDTPVILQEGFRYNAIHVAVKNNRKDMCQLIIDTLESQNFWAILLKEDSSSAVTCQRRHFLVDMYLNTPDKGNLETPLHFACKHGHVEVVEYLVSHPLTDTRRENKYGETPMQIICSRCSVPCSEEKNRIGSLLEDNCFVPLLGSFDNSTPSWIGEPWSPEGTDDKSFKEKRWQGNSFDKMKEWSNPVEVPVTVRAYAGPMSPSKAEHFYHSWKIPPQKKEQRNSYIHIKRKDDSRGVERIGRQLAHNVKVPWTEYWSFLGGYADFSNLQGIAKLENYLAKNREQLLFNRLSITPQRVEVPKSISGIQKTPESRQSSVILQANVLLNEGMNVQPDKNSGIILRDVHHGSSRKSLFSNSVESENERREGRKDSSPLIQVSDVELVKTLTVSLDKLSASCQEEGRSKEPVDASLTESPKKQDVLNVRDGDFDLEGDRGIINSSGALPCKKKLFSFSQETKNVEVPLSVHMERDTPNNGIDGNKTLLNVSNGISSSRELKEDANDNDEVFENHFTTDEKSENQCEKHLSHFGAAEIKVPLKRYLKSQKGQSYVFGSGNQDINIFIQGLQPSKLDLDVFIAIGQTTVDSKKFPNVAKWQTLIMSYSDEKQQSWPSPGSPRYKTTRHKSLMWSC